MRRIETTAVPTLIVDRKDIDTKYRILGYGSEGEVYNYNDLYALKKFALCGALEPINSQFSEQKLRKVEEMTKVSDPSICFPLGIFGFEERFMEGCFYPIVRYELGRKDFEDLELFGVDERIEYLIRGCKGLRRLHELGLIMGDVKEDNIMIDRDGNPVYVDVDNYSYQEYDFDLLPNSSLYYQRMYHKECSGIDNDIMLYTLMCLRIIFREKGFEFLNKRENINYLIEELDVPDYIKEHIRELLSDSQDKIYPVPMLQCIRKYKR